MAHDRATSDGPAHAVPLLDGEAARAGDAAAVDAGDRWDALMVRAAGHLARGVVAAAGHGYGLRVALVVGKGNNGGDGWAAASRLQRDHGAIAWVVAPDGADVATSDETTAHRDAWRRAGGRTSSGTDDLDAVVAWCDVAVDCLLGTGSSGAPRGPAADAAAALARARDRGVTVVACDVPSGVSADDGTAPEGAVRADLTVTFGALKRGLLLHPGTVHAGRVLLGDLGAAYDPAGAVETVARERGSTARWQALTPTGAAPPAYGPATDKRSRGVVLAVAGAVGTSGAAALTGRGALAAGAGLVTVTTPAAVRGEVAAHHPATMVQGLPADDQGAVAAEAVHALPDLAGIDAVVAGPGLGFGAGAAEVVGHLRRRAHRVVLDADAINVHRDDPGALADHRGDLVLTPHERELARIGGGADGADAWANRVERVPRLAADLDATIVAKGPGTMVAAPDGRVWVTPLGGPALGSGGTGDVLAGIVAAAIASADDVPLAVARAVWWHAAAGERAGATRAGRADALDLLSSLPDVLRALDAGFAHDAADAADAAGATRAPGTLGPLPSGRVRATTGGSPSSVHGPPTSRLPWDAWRERP